MGQPQPPSNRGGSQPALLTPDGYRVLDKNAAETVATVAGTPGDAVRIGTLTLATLQEFVARLAGIARPEDEIDLYLDYYLFLGKPVVKGGTTMVLAQGRIVEGGPDDPGSKEEE
ncbi:MAG: hypothetical protein WC343_13075 [Bacilli bacterium]|jgi:hypothetical protein